MQIEVLSKTLEELKEKSEIYQNQIELTVLENCPFIVEVGALTVCTNENGVVEAQNLEYPMQFSQKGADIILEMTWRNGNGEIVRPIVYGRNDWYRSRLQMIKESMELFDINQKTINE